jgi:hypothetical protein
VFGRKRIIYDRDGITPYMHRWHLLFRDKVDNFSKGRKVPFNAYLHKIVLSDEPVFHDHPWDYFTIILKGGYWEHTPEGKFWRGPGHMRFSKAGSLHYLEIPQGGSAWTLFFRFGKKKEWGFIKDGEWVHYQTYLKERMQTQSRLNT